MSVLRYSYDHITVCLEDIGRSVLHFLALVYSHIYGENMASFEQQGTNNVELCALNVSRSRYDDITAGLEDIERSVRIARVAAVLSEEDLRQLLKFESRCKHHWRSLYFQKNPRNNLILLKVHLREVRRIMPKNY